MPKIVKKTAAKKPAKKTAAKTTKVPGGAGVKKTKAAKKPVKSKPAKEKKEKGGITDTQVRILKALSKAKNGLTRAQVSAKAPCESTQIGKQAGYFNDEINSRECHAGNLVNLKLVKIGTFDIKGKDTNVYTITAAGKKAIA